MALEEGAGAVMGIDDPAQTRIGMVRDTGFFSYEPAAEQRQQLLAQHDLNLLIDVGVVATAAGPWDPVELGDQHVAAPLDARDDTRQQIWKEASHGNAITSR
jgi:hypothetical protein